MQTLLRVLMVAGVLVGLAFGVMTAMIAYLTPVPRDISQPIPLPTNR